MLKIPQARLQQYMNRELPDVQAGFRKGRGTRDQIANIRWIIKNAREFQKNIYFCFIDYAKTLTYSFPNFEPVFCSMCVSNYCFLTCIQVSQETIKVIWYSHLFKNFQKKKEREFSSLLWSI